MKYLKILFSKIFISFLAFCFQVALVFTVFLFYEQYFVWFQIVSIAVAVLVFLGVVNKEMNPEFKVPWIVLIFAVPFFGTVLYLMFANSRIPTGQYRRMVEIYCRCESYVAVPEAENKAMLASLGNCAGMERFLRKNSFSRGYTGSKASFFTSGEQFFQDLLIEVKGAKKFIFMEYFTIEKGKFWNSVHEVLVEKVKQGVEVRVMYDDIGCAGRLRGGYYKTLKKEGINCVKFNPFYPVISGIHNNRDHRKITVIDGKIAYTGGVNITDEYINEVSPYGHWKDTVVKIEGEAVNNFTVMFLQLFDSTAKTVSEYGKYLFKEREKFEDGGYVHPFGDGPKPFYREQVGESVYIDLINKAEKYVYITTPYLIPDYNLVTAIKSAAYRGVDVRIITPHVPDKKIIFNMTRSNYKQLLQAGVKIYEYTPGFIHAKGMVADDVIAAVGTINLDYRSLVHHYECGVVIYKSPCVEEVAADFVNTQRLCIEINDKNYKMPFLASLLNAVLRLFSPML